MNSKVGIAVDDGVRTSARAGYLLYGPYIGLRPGSYRVSSAISGSRAGWSFVEVVAGPGPRVLARKRIRRADLAARRVTLDFNSDEHLQDVEFRLSVNKFAKLAVSEIAVEQI